MSSTWPYQLVTQSVSQNGDKPPAPANTPTSKLAYNMGLLKMTLYYKRGKLVSKKVFFYRITRGGG